MITNADDWKKLIVPFKSGVEVPIRSFIQDADNIQAAWLELDEETYEDIKNNCTADKKLYWDEILPISIYLKTLSQSSQDTIQYAGHTKESPDAKIKSLGNVSFGIECVTADGYDARNPKGKWFETLDPRTRQWEMENEKIEKTERKNNPDGITFFNPTIPITKESGIYQRETDRALFSPESSYEIIKDRIVKAFSNKENMRYVEATKLLVVVGSLANHLNISYGKYLQKLKQELILLSNYSNIYIVNVANPQIYEL